MNVGWGFRSRAGLVALLLAVCGTTIGMRVANQGPSMKVALCQILCLDGDREGNFARIEHALQDAQKLGAQLACLPETAILGWVNPEAHRLACPIPGPDSDRLSDLARKYGMYLCAGLAEKDGDRLFDSVLLIDDRGRILAKHRKMNILRELMTPPYSRGDQVEIVETPIGRIGLLICADSFLADYVEKLHRLRPEIVLIPYGWAAPMEDWPEHAKELEKIVTKVARSTEAYVIGTDLVGMITHGPWTGQTYGGRSIAADPQGAVLARGRDRDRDIVIVSVPR